MKNSKLSNTDRLQKLGKQLHVLCKTYGMPSHLVKRCRRLSGANDWQFMLARHMDYEIVSREGLLIVLALEYISEWAGSMDVLNTERLTDNRRFLIEFQAEMELENAEKTVATLTLLATDSPAKSKEVS